MLFIILTENEGERVCIISTAGTAIDEECVRALIMGIRMKGTTIEKKREMWVRERNAWNVIYRPHIVHIRMHTIHIPLISNGCGKYSKKERKWGEGEKCHQMLSFSLPLFHCDDDKMMMMGTIEESNKKEKRKISYIFVAMKWWWAVHTLSIHYSMYTHILSWWYKKKGMHECFWCVYWAVMGFCFTLSFNMNTVENMKSEMEEGSLMLAAKEYFEKESVRKDNESVISKTLKYHQTPPIDLRSPHTFNVSAVMCTIFPFIYFSFYFRYLRKIFIFLWKLSHTYPKCNKNIF